MKGLIIDDEKHCSSSLKLLLEKHVPLIDNISVANNPHAGLGLITTERPDVVFLDIEMPKLNGFQLLSSIPQVDFKVIFTTAYDEFALNAFKVNAIDYLLKPVEAKELISAVNKAAENIEKQDSQDVKEIIANIAKYDYDHTKIALPTLQGFEFVKPKNIVRCESESNYTHIYLLEGVKHTISRTLGDIEQQLEPFGFLRVHNSHLINMHYIKSYEKGDGGLVKLENGDHVMVSRSRKKNFLDKL